LHALTSVLLRSVSSLETFSLSASSPNVVREIYLRWRWGQLSPNHSYDSWGCQGRWSGRSFRSWSFWCRASRGHSSVGSSTRSL